MRTAEEFKNSAKLHDIKKWDSHPCSLCGYVVGYIFPDGKVYYDNGCNCMRHAPPPTARTWEDVAEHYNMQTHPDVIKKMDEFWKFTPETKNNFKTVI